MTTQNAGANRPTYKVERSIERYGLDDMGAKLESKWLGIDGELSSLRDLAEYFNHRLLRNAIEQSELQLVDGEVENLYRLITADNVSSGNRTQARRKLEQAGVDVEQVESDFITHQAIHTYLTKGRGIRKEPNDTDRIDSTRKTIERMKSRTEIIGQRSLEQLCDTNDIVLGEFDILVDVTVMCSDCGAHKNISRLLTDGECDCN